MFKLHGLNELRRKTLRKSTPFVLGILIILSPILYLSFKNILQVKGAAVCPITDGGAGDADGIVNGAIVVGANTTWTADAAHEGVIDCSSMDITVNNGITLTFAPANDGDLDYTDDYGLTLLANSLTVTGTISANGNGYVGGPNVYTDPNGRGPGGSVGDTATSCGGDYGSSGGTHGGKGGSGNVAPPDVYGSVINPVNLGSGSGRARGNGTCGAGANGGGAIKIVTTGNLTINGIITANGNNGADNGRGGGSGGSIWLNIGGTFAGGGTVRANGGIGGGWTTNSGGGGGGRVAVYYPSSTFSGSITATGGQTPAARVGENGSVIEINTSNNNLYIKQTQRWVPDRDNAFETWFPSITDMTVNNNSTLSLDSVNKNQNSGGRGWVLGINNLTVSSGSTISASTYGYDGGLNSPTDPNGRGPGGSVGDTSATCSGDFRSGGGGHGGAGGTTINSAGGGINGNENAPADLGSGSGRSRGGGACVAGTSGGGAIKIQTTGNLVLDGTISANGRNATTYNAGGGAGGSVWLDVQGTFGGAGTGSITANGGNGSVSGGGGGGGRIAVYYNEKTFAGNTSVIAGTGGTGAAGGSSVMSGYPTVTNAGQYRTDGTTTITVGTPTNERDLIFKMDLSDGDQNDVITPEVEVKEVGQSFSNVATHTGASVAYNGSPVTISLNIAGLEDNSLYYWQARACDQQQLCSNWVQFGNNSGSSADFAVQKLVGYWKMDEMSGDSIKDSSGNDNHGTRTGAAWVGKNDCKINSCLSFDGSGDRVDIGDKTVLEPSTLTLNFWAKTRDFNRQWNGGVAKGFVFGNGSEYSYKLDFTLNTASASITNTSDQTTGITETTIDDNNWHMWTMTFDGTDVKLYKDARLVDTEPISGTFGNTGDEIFAVGSRPSGDGRYPIDGWIDEVRVFSGPLTQNEINVMYAEGGLSFGVGTNPEASLTSGPGNPPIGHWNFDNIAGTSLPDLSGNGNNGILQNGPATTDVTRKPVGANGLSNKVLVFDGSNDFVESTDDPFDFTSSFTISGWNYYRQNTVHNVIAGNSNGTDAGWLFRTARAIDGNRWVLFFGSNAFNSNSSVVELNKWVHVSVVFNDELDTVTFYKNGTHAGEVTGVTQQPAPNTFNLMLGKGPGLEVYTMSGMMDDMKIYNYARTPAQVAYDYNRGEPIAHWKFDECTGSQAFDSSGNNYTGTLNIGATEPFSAAGTCNSGNGTHAWNAGTTGKFNGSLGFDGVDDYVDVTGNLIRNSFSISLWYKRSSDVDDNQGEALMGQGNEFSLYFDYPNWSAGHTNELLFNWYEGSWRGAVTAGDKGKAINTWYHLVITYDELTDLLSMYLNGELVSQRTESTTYTGQTSFKIADYGYAQSTWKSFHGQLDDVRIYGYSLSPAQISQIMNNGSARFGP